MLLKLSRWVAFIQGGYYVALGLWPLLSITTFEKVTGPKTDDWLVQTVASLLIAIGLVLLAAVRHPKPSFDSALLGLTSAIALGAVNVAVVFSRKASPVYLLDAVLETTFLLGWFVAIAMRPRKSDVLAVEAVNPDAIPK